MKKTPGLALLLLTILIALAGCQGTPSSNAELYNTQKTGKQSGVDTAQRIPVYYDGLYRSDVGTNLRWLRFYDDGTVIGASTVNSADPDQVGRWLRRPYEDSGQYIIQGSEISFSLTDSNGTVDYKGTIENNSLNLHSYSHINGRSGDAKFVFIKMSL